MYQTRVLVLCSLVDNTRQDQFQVVLLVTFYQWRYHLEPTYTCRRIKRHAHSTKTFFVTLSQDFFIISDKKKEKKNLATVLEQYLSENLQHTC